MKTLIARVTAPTPPFFKILRTIGLGLAAIGGALLTAPVGLPVLVSTIGGYVALAGGLLSAVSQLAVGSDSEPTLKNLSDE